VNPNGPRHLIVTGGGGYIGRAVVSEAIATGLRITALSRDGSSLPANVRHLTWNIGVPIPEEALDPTLAPDAQALVHLAHDWTDTSADDNINLAGAVALRDSARRLGLGRLVFVSSQSARPDALNVYGRLKWRIEQLFDRPNETSLRVGLVYGGPRLGQYGLLCRLAMATSVIPMIAPRQPVQPIHRNEVARGVMLALTRDVKGPLGLAAPDPIAFAEFLDTLAWRMRGGRMWLIPVPLRPMLWLGAAMNLVPFGPRIDRERLLGLAGTRANPTAADLALLGLKLQPFADAIVKEPMARRAFLAQCRTMLRYILRREPGGALIRRCARAAASTGPDGAMRLAGILHRMPFLLRFIEPLGGESLLAQRLAVATALAEASPEGAIALQRRHRIARLSALCCDGIVELLAMPVRLAAIFRR
jgi:nucleoside-diphosphate-sugar epimerase